ARSDLSAVAQRAKAEATKQSMLPLCCEYVGWFEPCETHHLQRCKFMGIAEFIIGRAFARPVGLTLATLAREVPSVEQQNGAATCNREFSVHSYPTILKCRHSSQYDHD